MTRASSRASSVSSILSTPAQDSDIPVSKEPAPGTQAQAQVGTPRAPAPAHPHMPTTAVRAPKRQSRVQRQATTRSQPQFQALVSERNQIPSVEAPVPDEPLPSVERDEPVPTFPKRQRSYFEQLSHSHNNMAQPAPEGTEAARPQGAEAARSPSLEQGVFQAMLREALRENPDLLQNLRGNQGPPSPQGPAG